MINVIGLGYIGLPTALILAANGNQVIGTDINDKVIEKLNNNIIPFEEKGIESLFNSAKNNNIKFTQEVQKTDMYIITVPTPYIKASKKIDATFIQNAVKMILTACLPNTIIIIESTVSPGTIDKFVRPIIKESNFTLGEDMHLVHAPERILPGNMLQELERNSRTIGADDPSIGQKVKKIYKSFCKGDIILTDIRSAEMSKVVENTFRDINIAFANELAKICHTDNLDVYEIINLANQHPRVNILSPGPGVGGHCIPVDPWFLVGDYPETANLIKMARNINDSMPLYVLERIKEIMELNGLSDYSKVGIYGVTYKANVDDIRESPTLQLIDFRRKTLSEDLMLFDPLVQLEDYSNQCENFEEFIDKSELIVIMVGHTHIIDYQEHLAGKLVLDTQNVLANSKNIYKL